MVTLINPIEVPQGSEERCLDIWRRTADYLSEQDGFVSARLHRSLAPGARFRFVGISMWRDDAAISELLADEAFMALVDEMEFPSAPALYEVVEERVAKE
jgi:heme-degrading monooxygenase HmoA